VQFVFAGNDSEGLRYGAILTPEKMFLAWKEDVEEDSGYKLDKYLGKICAKPRFLELIRDFVIFDGGIKKLPAPTSPSGSRPLRSVSAGRRAASSGTPRARARAS
jgi:type I restriction enzyme R subunit